MLDFIQQNPAERRLLPEGRSAGPMPWVIAIMMLLTVLAVAAGIVLFKASGSLSNDIATRVTIQIPEADTARKTGQVRAIGVELSKMASIEKVRVLSDAELEALLNPWLGDVSDESAFPMPAMIDLDMKRVDDQSLAQIRNIIKGIAPSARVDTHASWLAPLAGLMQSLTWVALGLVALTTLAMVATVVLAVRFALNTHAETIAIMHLLGANDVQVARLFQRRIALDALLGCGLGFAAGVAVLLLLGSRAATIGSELLGSASLAWSGWLGIAALPVLGTLLAAQVARYTVTRSLGRTL